MLNDLAEAIRRWTEKSAEARSLHESKHGMQRQEQKVLGIFFSVQRHVASARSFNSYPSLLQMRLII